MDKQNKQVKLTSAIRRLTEKLSIRHTVDLNQCCRELVELTGDESAYKKAIRKRNKLDKLIIEQIQSIRQCSDAFKNLSDFEIKFIILQLVSIYSQRICTNRSDDIFDMIAFNDEERVSLRNSLKSGRLYHFFQREECRNGFRYELRSPEIFEQTFFE